jgi:hypothetical protein
MAALGCGDDGISWSKRLGGDDKGLVGGAVSELGVPVIESIIDWASYGDDIVCLLGNVEAMVTAAIIRLAG